MRIFLAGATGAVGKPLIRLLVAAGHEAGTEPVADGLDKDAVARAVRRTAPEVVVHELTALSHLRTNMRNLYRTSELTNRLRTEGSEWLPALAAGVGAKPPRRVPTCWAGSPAARPW